jgi:hypothetical protein
VIESRNLWSERSVSTSADAVAAIEGVEKLNDYFGGWPDFDSAEVISLCFERGDHLETTETGAWSARVPPNLTVVFRVRGVSAYRKDALATIRFHGDFERFAMDGFNYQNPIIGLEIFWEHSNSLGKRLFAVDWGGTAIHHDVSFTCQRIEVLAVKALA